MSKTQHGRELSGKEMCQMIDEFVNGADDEHYKDFLDTLINRTHRTLQQKIASLFLNSFEAWATLPENRYDLRNEATVKVSKTIVSAIKECFYKSLPTI